MKFLKHIDDSSPLDPTMADSLNVLFEDERVNVSIKFSSVNKEILKKKWGGIVFGILGI